MSVDKFGHHSFKNNMMGTRGPPGPPGAGFVITPDGNYDVENKLLKRVKYPEDDMDATNKKYVDDMNKNSYMMTLGDGEEVLNVGGRRIVGLSGPSLNTYDAVNKLYVDENLAKLQNQIKVLQITMETTNNMHS